MEGGIKNARRRIEAHFKKTDEPFFGHTQMSQAKIIDMADRYIFKKKTKRSDPPYRGKGYKDVAGSMAAFKNAGERPAADAGRKSNTYRANRSKFNGSSVRLNGFNDDAFVKQGPAPEPIRLNRSTRWLEAPGYNSARSASPSNLKVH